MSVALIRIGKAMFGFGVASLFAWYCAFWQRTFADHPPSAEGMGVPAGMAADAEVACREPAGVPLPATAAEAFVGPPAPARAPRDLADLAQDKMFQARIHGPYALSVRDGLNEMVIGTSLLARGILDDADAHPLDLAALLGAIPAQLPTYGYISSGYGTRRSPFSGRLVHHKGVDFAVRYGAPVVATADGVVTYAGWYHGLGRTVMINHGYGIVTKYGHNSAFAVHAGDNVRRGDQIASAGSTGRSTGSHVHYEVWVNGKAIDPSQFMFEVPDRAEAVAAVAMSPYGSRPSHHLGLAVGGDGALADVRRRTEPYDGTALLPLNLAIVGAFVFFVGVAVTTLWPRRSVIGRDII